MDGMAIVIAVGFIVCFLAYQMIKNHVLSKVSKAMQNQNYDLVLQLSEKSFYKRFMGSFVCDLYILRALLNKGDNIGFKKYLMETLEKPYTLEKRKEVLDIYFYHFLLYIAIVNLSTISYGLLSAFHSHYLMVHRILYPPFHLEDTAA